MVAWDTHFVHVLDSARAKFVSCNDAIERLLDLIKYEWKVDQFTNLDLLGSLVDVLLQAVAEDGNDVQQHSIGYVCILMKVVYYARDRAKCSGGFRQLCHAS